MSGLYNPNFTLKLSESDQKFPRQITTMSQDNTKGDEGTDTPPTYKEQLDQAAIKVKDPQSGANEGGVIGQVVEKGKTRPSHSWGFIRD